MMNFLLGGLALIFSLGMFNHTYITSSLNRCFLGLYNGIAESSLIAYSSSGSTMPLLYFDVSSFQKKVREYVREQIPFSTPTVYITMDYWNLAYPELEQQPDHVSVRLWTSGSFFDFDKTAVFTAIRLQ